MTFDNLREYLNILEEKGWLKRIRVNVSSIYEIAEITNRICKSSGEALLFENVDRYDIPVVTNLFGSMERIKLALGYDRLEKLGEDFLSLSKFRLDNILKKLSSIKDIKRYMNSYPKVVKKAVCKEKIIYDVDLNRYPILKLWPKDAGRFITFPIVITKDPENDKINLGTYRMQVIDKDKTLIHWHVHKHGYKNYLKNLREKKKMEVAVVIGCDPVTMLCSVFPIPENIDDYFFIGFIRKKPLKIVKCETLDLYVPANSEIVLEGYVTDEVRLEGPFGDHTGYYSQEGYYPVFEIECITQRENPIYVASVTGKPPMEDAYIGKAVERIFLPFIKFLIPEIVDINIPIEGLFHNILIVSIKKQYPGHAKKVMFSLWGLEYLHLTKIIIVVDHDVNVHNWFDVWYAISTRVDPARDVVIIKNTPTDTLDHAASNLNLGSKMGIDATRKFKEEIGRDFPEEVEASEEIKRLVSKKWYEYFH